jgi:hypothetical protein
VLLLLEVGCPSDEAPCQAQEATAESSQKHLL